MLPASNDNYSAGKPVFCAADQLNPYFLSKSTPQYPILIKAIPSDINHL